MKALRTPDAAHVTERQKAWARLALLTVVGLVCPPLAAARSGVVWGVYLLLVVVYSLWAVRLTSTASFDSRIGYLLCVADAAAIMPILVWSLGAAMPVVLCLLWVLGVFTSWRAAGAQRGASRASTPRHRDRAWLQTTSKDTRVGSSAEGAPLERSLRVRLGVLQTEGTRFGLVLLRLSGYEEMIADSGKEATKDFLREAGNAGLRLLGPDAQVFPLPGGRMAFVFVTDSARRHGAMSESGTEDRMDAYDIESIAMALACRACEPSLGDHRLECVVGWASAPADGTTADDLMYAGESGALSSAAFRRVRGSRIPVPHLQKKRAIAS